MKRLKRVVLIWAMCTIMVIVVPMAQAAPYAAMVVDARSGKILHSRNADTRLHPASLTKMMTLYVVFDAIRRGEITLDTKVRVSKYAASQPPSKLYLKSGQTIALRYLIRASAVKSANDAALTMAEAISGSEKAFADRMNRTARALGMTRTTFKNPHGLTRSGHLSTARDMTTLGRALFYHFPEYYNLFSRRTTNAGGKTVNNTNRRLLNAYKGADGIKTGYTRAAGFNLVASAERGNVRVIATMFGGSSGASRNARVAELLDMGFQRAKRRVAVRPPARPNVSGGTPQIASVAVESRTRLAVARSVRPAPRRLATVSTSVSPVINGLEQSIEDSLRGVAVARAASTAALPEADELAEIAPTPKPMIEDVVEPAVKTASAYAAPVSPSPQPRPAVITFSSSDASTQTASLAGNTAVSVPRFSTSGDRHWGISVGIYNSEYEAERVLLKTALVEIETLDNALRKVVKRPTGYSADFVGLDERSASLACQRLSARNQSCTTFGP